MTSIYDGLLSELEVFIERNLTINSNILQSLAEHAINYEHQFYLEWLQDLKKIV